MDSAPRTTNPAMEAETAKNGCFAYVNKTILAIMTIRRAMATRVTLSFFYNNNDVTMIMVTMIVTNTFFYCRGIYKTFCFLLCTFSLY